MKTEIAQEAMKSTPPVLVTVGAATATITLNEWVAIATIIYIVMQAGYLLWKWWGEYHKK